MKQKKTLTDFKAENERLPSDREIFVCGFRSGARFSEYVGCAFGGPSPRALLRLFAPKRPPIAVEQSTL